MGASIGLKAHPRILSCDANVPGVHPSCADFPSLDMHLEGDYRTHTRSWGLGSGGFLTARGLVEFGEEDAGKKFIEIYAWRFFGFGALEQSR